MEPRISILTLGVRDLEKSYQFYKTGLGFPTHGTPDQGIVFFQTKGTCFALYPFEKLAEDIGERFKGKGERSSFSGITLAHNTRTQEEVDQIIQQAVQAGAHVEKPPQATFWGGYSGYFSDPDGYLWEVAYGAFDFNEDGSLIIP